MEKQVQLSCEMLSHFIHTQVIPDLVWERRERDARELGQGSELLTDEEGERKETLAEYGISSKSAFQPFIHGLKSLVIACYITCNNVY
jgi:hypothetical protein